MHKMDYSIGRLKELAEEISVEVSTDAANGLVVTIHDLEYRCGLGREHGTDGEPMTAREAYCFIVGLRIGMLMQATRFGEAVAMATCETINKEPA